MIKLRLALLLSLIAVLVTVVPVSAHGSAINGPAGIACTRGAGTVSIVIDNPIVSSSGYVYMANGVYSSARGWMGYTQTNGQYWQFSWADNTYPSYFYNYGSGQWNDYSAFQVQDWIAGPDTYWVYQYFYWSDGHQTAMWTASCTP